MVWNPLKKFKLSSLTFESNKNEFLFSTRVVPRSPDIFLSGGAGGSCVCLQSKGGSLTVTHGLLPSRFYGVRLDPVVDHKH